MSLGYNSKTDNFLWVGQTGVDPLYLISRGLISRGHVTTKTINENIANIPDDIVLISYLLILHFQWH